MRFFVRRYLKSVIYFIVALFVFNLVQKHAEFTERKGLLEVDHQFSPLDGDFHPLNGIHAVMDRSPEQENLDAGDNEEQAADDKVQEGADNEEEEMEEEEEEEENEDFVDEYAEEDAGPDPVDLKEVKEQHGHGPALGNAQPGEVGRGDSPAGEKNKEDLQDFFRERELVYKERRNHIREVCHRLGPEGAYGSLDKAPLRRLRWLNKKRLIMCFNAKVGTSTWTQYLMEVGYPGLLKNVSHWHYTAERLLKPPHKRGSDASISLMKEYTKIILVRDPFARIVSAYLDKIARMRFASLCRFIIQKYRKETSKLKQRHPSFEEFVLFLVEHTPRADDIRAKRDHRSDRHWFHYYANCAPCDIPYDIVATMESVHEDTRYIMEKYQLGLKDTVWNNHQAKSSSEEMAIKLFQEIPRNLTLELYQRYRVDFLMFGYSVEKYLAP